jgi:23S rRNA (uracil1939-C5)-methyltransferase
LQPSTEGQNVLGNLVLGYMKNIKGNIADLFCGVGTFSYLLADIDKVKIVAIDSSEELLKGFTTSLNRNQITNIKIKNKNLFKYPLDENELKDFDAILFDPPRAGAKSLCEKLATAPQKPAILVAVSCNPNTFLNDAKILISGGYRLKEVTMVDQFIYSNHSELVAFFTKD